MIRRIAIPIGAAICAAMTLSAAAQDKEPIRVGLMTADAGSLAFVMPHFIEPAKLAVDMFNAQGGVLGRKFEVVLQTHNATPAGALAAATRLVQQEKVSFISGFTTSGISLAIAPRLDGLGALLLDSTAQSKELTTKKCYANYFRSSVHDGMNVRALRNVVRDSGIKNWTVVGADWAFGRDFDSGFRELVAEFGGTVQNSVFTPVGTSDFGSAIAQLGSRQTEGLAVALSGNEGINFAKQQKQFGLFPKFKTVVSVGFTSDMVLGAQGDSTVGVYAPLGFAPEYPGAKSQAFVKLWQERFKRPPSNLEADSWQAIELLHAAIQRAGSTDVAAVRKALLGLKANTVVGDVEMRSSDHQLMRSMALVQIESAGEGKSRQVLRNLVPADQATPAAVLNCN
ncbi:ABC transporter substrate-binding protein [Hydrogenophaga palleronii]|uniref:ABC transporter substrate-binding protein n=1 Tax=Hydrogenophaga palleronii TaxID=65655 RepID=UPI00082670F0|nr:ABC transporter substrate-binding protein [Hydrogenophaga palleronii]